MKTLKIKKYNFLIDSLKDEEEIFEDLKKEEEKYLNGTGKYYTFEEVFDNLNRKFLELKTKEENEKVGSNF